MILIDDTSSVYIQRMNVMYKGEYTEVNLQYTEKMRKLMDNDLGDLLDLCNLVSLFYHHHLSRHTLFRISEPRGGFSYLRPRHVPSAADRRRIIGEVEVSPAASEAEKSSVEGTRRLLGSVVRPQPYAFSAVGKSDL